MAMATLVETGPQNRPIDTDVSPHVAHIILGQVIGYAEYHQSLLELGVQPKVIEKVEADYLEE